jgi:hypothetical protein
MRYTEVGRARVSEVTFHYVDDTENMNATDADGDPVHEHRGYDQRSRCTWPPGDGDPRCE